jgi:hypothetical protein
VELKTAPFAFGVCIYCRPDAAGNPLEFVCCDGATGVRKWSWKRLRFVDTSPWVDQLQRDLVAIFSQDPQVEITGIRDEFPDWESGGDQP